MPMKSPTADSRVRGAVRIILGTAQVMAATATLALLFWSGPTWPTLAGTAVTALLVLCSRLLFRGT
jgi:hypothetical protein